MIKLVKRGCAYVMLAPFQRIPTRLPHTYGCHNNGSGARLIIHDVTVMTARGGTFLCTRSGRPFAALRSTAFLTTRNERLGIRLRIAG